MSPKRAQNGSQGRSGPVLGQNTGAYAAKFRRAAKNLAEFGLRTCRNRVGFHLARAIFFCLQFGNVAPQRNNVADRTATLLLLFYVF